MADVYPLITQLLAGTTRPVIMEIGSHFGQDSRKLRELFPDATLYLFEPDPRNTYVIRQSLPALKGELIEAAIGAQDGDMLMHLSSGTNPAATITRSPATRRPWSQSSSLKAPKEHLRRYPWVKFDQTTKVKVVTLDTFFAQRGLECVDLIWADVQGAEDLMIAGGQQALRKTRYLFTECSDVPLYEGQIGLAEIMQRLPGSWRLVETFDYDVLLENRDLTGA